jgi:hypothetical protein
MSGTGGITRRCTCGGSAPAIRSVWRISHGLPEGTTWTFRCGSCGTEFTIFPVALMVMYQAIITGLGVWLVLQALQLEDSGLRTAFLGVAVPIALGSVPLGWVTFRRLVEWRKHPSVRV